MRACNRRYRLLSILFAAAATMLAMPAMVLPLQADRPQSRSQETSTMHTAASNPTVQLPEPIKSGNVSVEQALEQRRSIRSFRKQALQRKEISQLLWAAQGLTDPKGLRAAPSAGATYPLELYLVNGNGGDLDVGLYKYAVASHRLVTLDTGDLRASLSRAALNQGAVARAPATVVICAVYDRTTGRYGERGIRYVHMEAGHAAQNLYLQAEALNLGGVVIGAFRDREVARILQLPAEEVPLYLMPIGYPE